MIPAAIWGEWPARLCADQWEIKPPNENAPRKLFGPVYNPCYLGERGRDGPKLVGCI